MTENKIEFEVWNDKQIEDCKELYRIKKVAETEDGLVTIEGHTYFQQFEAMVKIIDFYGEELHSLKFEVSDTDLKRIRKILSYKPRRPPLPCGK